MVSALDIWLSLVELFIIAIDGPVTCCCWGHKYSVQPYGVVQYVLRSNCP